MEGNHPMPPVIGCGCMRESPTARARCPTLPGARRGVKVGLDHTTTSHHVLHSGTPPIFIPAQRGPARPVSHDCPRCPSLVRRQSGAAYQGGSAMKRHYYLRGKSGRGRPGRRRRRRPRRRTRPGPRPGRRPDRRRSAVPSRGVDEESLAVFAAAGWRVVEPAAGRSVDEVRASGGERPTPTPARCSSDAAVVSRSPPTC